MSLVANVAGISVYSDKELSYIKGTTITFTDGSWCDVRSGRVVNNGPGYINIGEQPSSSQGGKKITKQYAFLATSLDVRDVYASIDINVHNGSEIQVVVHGYEKDVNLISVSKQGNSVVVLGKNGGRSGGTTVVSGSSIIVGDVRGSIIAGDVFGGSYISVNDGNINSIVVGGMGQVSTQITILLPVGTPVSISDVIGNTKIGDTCGDLTLRVVSSDTVVGEIRSLNANVKGGGGITVSHVRGGNVSINVMGSGSVSVGGETGTLGVNIMGSGPVTFSGTAMNASLSIMGSGNIFVSRVINQPMRSVMGSGRIRIGNW